MTSVPNLTELKQCLQEAGMYEENMNEDEMRSCYDAIKSSESTAKEENEQRNNESILGKSNVSDDTDDMVLFSEKERVEEEVSNVVEEDKEDEGKLILDPTDCSPIKHKLTTIHHAPRYNLPPHIDPKLKKLSVRERANVILKFHRKVSQKYYEHINKSNIPAPLRDWIGISEISKVSLDHANSNTFDELIGEPEKQETYTLRSGRQIKRKVYSEDIDSDCDKKRWKETDEDNEYTPTAKRQTTTKLSNQEIMKRSKFFSEASSPQTPSRSDTVFDQLMVSEKKRRMEEQKIESLKRNLPDAEEDDGDDEMLDCRLIDDHSPIVGDSSSGTSEDVTERFKDSPATKRRVPPPIHGRRGIGKRTPAVSLSKIDTLKPVKQTNTTNKQTRTVRRPVNVASICSPSTSKNPEAKEKNTKEMAKCPICSDFFHRDQVEEHASNCGLGMDTPIIFEPSSSPIKPLETLTCGICDKVLPMNTDYEIHVAECMERYKMKLI